VLPPKPWQPEAVLRLILWLFVSLSAGSLLLHALNPGGASAASAELKFLNFLVGTAFLHGAVLVLVAVFLRQHRIGWREGFGFRAESAAEAVAGGVLVAGIALPVAAALAFASAEAMSRLADTTRNEIFAPVPQQAVTTIREAAHPWQQVVFGVFAIGIAPVTEELLFRGVLYPTLKQNGWPRGAWLVTSCIFALTHANAMTFLPLLALSLALIWLYERTGNLLAPVTAHSLFNAANFYQLMQLQPPAGS